MSRSESLTRVSVRIVCGCGATREFCVPVDKEVPGPLRCAPPPAGGSGGGGAIKCPNGHPCSLGLSELRDRASLELEHGRGRHVKEDAVVIECD